MALTRKQKGSLAAELPIALWALFMIITMPMINLATISLRSTFIVTASRDAAHSAARAKTFQTAINASNPSATQLAQQAVDQDFQKFPGVHLTSVTTNIVTTSLATNVTPSITTRQSTPLSQPPDTSANTYSIEVIVRAQADPLVMCDATLIGRIPGLSAPVDFTCASREFCELPQGLTQ